MDSLMPIVEQARQSALSARRSSSATRLDRWDSQYNHTHTVTLGIVTMHVYLALDI